MGKVECHGNLCFDEDTGRVFFLPDEECSQDNLLKVSQEAIMQGGITIAKPIQKNKETLKATKNK